MYTLISGSPKPYSSNSLYFLKKIGNELPDYRIYKLKKDKYSDIIDNINLSDVIVIAFPLYVDSPTALTLNFFDYIIDNGISLKNKLVYFVINCGFKEGEQNITALNIAKNWCDKVGCCYGGALLIGAGEIVGKKKYRFISRKALKELSAFSFLIKNKENNEDIITTMDLLNNKLYCFLANLSWNKNCKKNSLSALEIRLK